jgi:uncharacterized protein (TIGR02996 family)
MGEPMTDDELGFFRAARDQPADDTIRLVYADWLDEHGTEAYEAQARFVRTQVERSRLALDDPRRVQLLDVEANLLQAYRREWNGRIHRWLHAQGMRNAWKARRSWIRAMQYHRGMISHVTLNSYFVVKDIFADAIAIASKLGPIQGVRVVGWPPQSWAVAMPTLRTIGPLRLVQCTSHFPWREIYTPPHNNQARLNECYRQLPNVPILDLRDTSGYDMARIHEMMRTEQRSHILLGVENRGGAIAHTVFDPRSNWSLHADWFADFLGDATKFDRWV